MASDIKLLAPFEEGEIVTIQRTVDGQNVLMVVVVRDPCSLSSQGTTKKPEARVTLNGWSQTWGVSTYADARVERQRQSIERLLAHLQVHCVDAECPHRDAVDVIEALIPAAWTEAKAKAVAAMKLGADIQNVVGPLDGLKSALEKS